MAHGTSNMPACLYFKEEISQNFTHFKGHFIYNPNTIFFNLSTDSDGTR